MALPAKAPSAAAVQTRVFGNICSVHKVAHNERCSSQSPTSTSGRAPSADGAWQSNGRRAALLSGTALISGVLTGFCPPSHAEEPDVPLKEHISKYLGESVVLKYYQLAAQLKGLSEIDCPAGKTLRAPAKFLRQRLRADGGSKILAPIRASKRRLLVFLDLPTHSAGCALKSSVLSNLQSIRWYSQKWAEFAGRGKNSPRSQCVRSQPSDVQKVTADCAGSVHELLHL